MMDLGGRAVAIAGGAGDLGRAIARVLLEHGARVALIDRNAQALAAACCRRCRAEEQHRYLSGQSPFAELSPRGLQGCCSVLCVSGPCASVRAGSKESALEFVPAPTLLKPFSCGQDRTRLSS